MAMWDVDLTTRMGVHSAIRGGSTACFVFAAMGALGAIVGFSSMAQGSEAAAMGIGGALECLVGLFTGWRMRGNTGFVMAIITAVLLGLELVGKIVAFSITGTLLCTVVLVYIVNGIRGLRALKGTFDEDHAEVFS